MLITLSPTPDLFLCVSLPSAIGKSLSHRRSPSLVSSVADINVSPNRFTSKALEMILGVCFVALTRSIFHMDDILLSNVLKFDLYFGQRKLSS
ncbi:hypothetical protein Ccrd_016043 [Cynara cardunculus var. scolymus]|uniref:Uncharacterized protein n=1 Tax=Cynara cardunculus var. scolymus TaxID=59895 RepID=A0A103YAP5_CYNCS|nr:hypothetical protein Ccrd_016043 [Cynara cardunculus var. scolymus]